MSQMTPKQKIAHVVALEALLLAIEEVDETTVSSSSVEPAWWLQMMKCRDAIRARLLIVSRDA